VPTRRYSLPAPSTTIDASVRSSLRVPSRSRALSVQITPPSIGDPTALTGSAGSVDAAIWTGLRLAASPAAACPGSARKRDPQDVSNLNLGSARKRDPQDVSNSYHRVVA
jgi:hypothetical protein